MNMVQYFMVYVYVYLFVDDGVILWCMFVDILYNVVFINIGIIFLNRE